jgi:hypothetical protein
MQCCAARPKKAHPGPHQSPSRERANGGAPRGAHDDFGPPRATRQPRKAGGQPPATVERPTTLAPYGEKEQPIEEDSDDGNEVFFDADEEFQLVPGTENGAASGGVVDYGVGEEGQCVIGGRWVNATQAINALEGGFTVTKAIGWDQPDPRETEPLTAAEAADSAMLAKRVGDALYRTLPADLQLAFVRDVYGNYEGCGWTEEQAIPNTVEVMRNAARWRAEIDAENLHKSPDLPREDVFRDYAQHAFSGQDKWGHPRIWGTVTGWPPIKQEIVDNFSAEEVMKMHTKRFLEFQDKKRKISEELQRTIILYVQQQQQQQQQPHACVSIYPRPCLPTLTPTAPDRSALLHPQPLDCASCDQGRRIDRHAPASSGLALQRIASLCSLWFTLLARLSVCLSRQALLYLGVRADDNNQPQEREVVQRSVPVCGRP